MSVVDAERLQIQASVLTSGEGTRSKARSCIHQKRWGWVSLPLLDSAASRTGKSLAVQRVRWRLLSGGQTSSAETPSTLRGGST